MNYIFKYLTYSLGKKIILHEFDNGVLHGQTKYMPKQWECFCFCFALATACGAVAFAMATDTTIPAAWVDSIHKCLFNYLDLRTSLRTSFTYLLRHLFYG